MPENVLHLAKEDDMALEIIIVSNVDQTRSKMLMEDECAMNFSLDMIVLHMWDHVMTCVIYDIHLISA